MTSPSFLDVHGATVTISHVDAPVYLGVKAEQLYALTQLMVNVQVGAIELDEHDREIFQLMVNEYAKAVQDLVDICVSRKKGGA